MISWSSHPFPYAAPDFVQHYEAILKADHLSEIESIRQQLRGIPAVMTEYMVCAGGKEGFARFIENQIKHRLGLPENHAAEPSPSIGLCFLRGRSALYWSVGPADP